MMSHKTNKVSAIRALKRLGNRQILPRPAPSVLHDLSRAGPIVIAGMFNTANGVGELARSFYKGMLAVGLEPIAVDTSEILDQVDMSSGIPIQTMPSNHAGVLLLLANPPEVETLLYRLGMRRWRNWHIIGYWCWELEQVPADWAAASRLVSEVWTLSEFTKSALQAATDRPIRVANAPLLIPTLGQSEENRPYLNCLIMADGRSSFARKNVPAAIRIFLAAFGATGVARLTVKTRNLSEFSEFEHSLRRMIGDNQSIQITDRSVDDNERWQILKDHDVIISAHRAEGLGLHLAEAMALGKCVVATGWSGNMHFMTLDNSIPLPFSMQPVDDEFSVYASTPGARWAKVDEDAGTRALISLANDPQLRKRLGERARIDIQEKFSISNLTSGFT